MNPDKLNPTLPQAPPSPVEADDREPTKEELMEDIRQGLRDVMSGYEGQDAMEFLDELRRELYGDANYS